MASRVVFHLPNNKPALRFALFAPCLSGKHGPSVHPIQSPYPAHCRCREVQCTLTAQNRSTVYVGGKEAPPTLLGTARYQILEMRQVALAKLLTKKGSPSFLRFLLSVCVEVVYFSLLQPFPKFQVPLITFRLFVYRVLLPPDEESKQTKLIEHSAST